MRKNIKKIFSKISQKKYFLDILFIFSLSLITLYYLGALFKDYLGPMMIGGWDGTSHYAITKCFTEHVFPRVFGWIKNYYAGMPFPLFYPPFFYFLVALISQAPFISVLFSFKFIIVFLTFTLPWIIYIFAKKAGGSKLAGFSAGLLTIFFLVSKETGGFGVSVEATFGSGLVTQLLGYYLMVLWLCFFVEVPQKKSSFYWSTFLFTFTLLSNAHVVPVALVVFSIIALFKIIYSQEKFKLLRIYLLNIFLSFGLAFFWYLPLLSKYTYATTMVFKSVSLKIIFQLWLGVIIMGLVGGIVAFKKKNAILVSLFFSSLIFLIFTLPLQRFISGLPIQPGRLIVALCFFMSILAGYAIVEVSNKFRSKLLFLFAFFILIFPFFFYLKPTYPYLALFDTKAEMIDQLSWSMKNLKDGRSMTETFYGLDPGGRGTLPTHFVANALIGAAGSPSIWTVFRESSITSPFSVPLRNAFSKYHESFGIVSMLSNDSEFYNQDLRKHIERAKLFNLKYFILREGETIKRFRDLPEKFTQIGRFGWWHLFKLNENSNYIEVPKYCPALVFTDLKTKERPYAGLDAYDWLRINEEWFHQPTWNFDVILARSKNEFFDKTKDLEKFKIAIIANWKYKNLENAYQRLINYAEKHKLILLSYPDPLFNKLKNGAKTNSNIFIIDRSANVRETCWRLLKLLDKIKIPLTGPKIISRKFLQEEIDVILEKSKQKELIPVYIKSSYLPNWRDENKGDVYLASPTFILVLANQDEVKLRFRYDYWDKIGILISLLSLITIIFIPPRWINIKTKV